MSYLDDFCDATHRFLLHNVVYVIIPNGVNGLMEAVVEPRQPAATVQNIDAGKRNGVVAGGVYKLRTRTADDPRGLPIYFCGYRQHKTIPLMLSDQAFWMFTPTMDGCTFGVGSQAAGQGGTVRVAHTNKTGKALDAQEQGATFDEARLAQQTAQHQSMVKQVGANGLFIEPDTYRDADLSKKATTFGFLEKDGIWRFMALSYGMASNVAIHHGLIDYHYR